MSIIEEALPVNFPPKCKGEKVSVFTFRHGGHDIARIFKAKNEIRSGFVPSDKDKIQVANNESECSDNSKGNTDVFYTHLAKGLMMEENFKKLRDGQDVKIFHDTNENEVWKKHNLQQIQKFQDPNAAIDLVRKFATQDLKLEMNLDLMDKVKLDDVVIYGTDEGVRVNVFTDAKNKMKEPLVGYNVVINNETNDYYVYFISQPKK